jgi:hypothetical protein
VLANWAVKVGRVREGEKGRRSRPAGEEAQEGLEN